MTNRSLSHILRNASQSQRLALCRIIGSPLDSPSVIESKIKSLYSIRSEEYKIILCGICNKLGVVYKHYYTEKKLEVLIAQKVFENIYCKMNHEQQMIFQNTILKEQFDSQFKASVQVGGIFTCLTAAQLSGFGVYVLATTTLGSITGALGLTLPFAFYTSLTSSIAFIIGPVGWVAAGFYSYYKLNQPNYEKLIKAILYILNLRIEQERVIENLQ